MTLEFFRAISPLINLILIIAFGIVGWVVKHLLEDIRSSLIRLEQDHGRQIKIIQKDVKSLQEKRETDIKYLLERFTPSDQFMAEVGAHRRVVDDIFKRINELNATVNQLIGQWKVMKGIYDEHLRATGQHKGPHSTGS